MNPVWFAILMIAIIFNIGIIFWGKSRGNNKKQRLHNTKLKKKEKLHLSIFDRLLFLYVLSMVALLFCDVLGINVFFSFSTMIINMICSCYLYIHYVKRRNREVHYDVLR
ncbi:hypothetical protein [Bacillus mycoides]|uniref:hypothetical protein n=1 Tax=Bacillus mycoides TaxID=1405 RepID=UPI003D662CFB